MHFQNRLFCTHLALSSAVIYMMCTAGSLRPARLYAGFTALSVSPSESLTSSGHPARSMHWQAVTRSHWSLLVIYLFIYLKAPLQWKHMGDRRVKMKEIRDHTFQNSGKCRSLFNVKKKKKNVQSTVYSRILWNWPEMTLQIDHSISHAVHLHHAIPCTKSKQ